VTSVHNGPRLAKALRVGRVLALAVAVLCLVVTAVCAVLIVQKQDDNHQLLVQTQRIELANACYARSQAVTALGSALDRVTPDALGLGPAGTPQMLQRNALSVCADLLQPTALGAGATTTKKPTP
jgi:hypothetical protein